MCVDCFAKSMFQAAKNETSFPACGYMISSILSFTNFYNNFDDYLLKLIPPNSKTTSIEDNNILKQCIDSIIGCLNENAKNLIEQLLDISFFSSFDAFQLTTYLETMILLLQPKIPDQIFKTIVDDLALSVSNHIAKLVLTAPRVIWNFNTLSNFSRGLVTIANLSIFISYPSARSNFSGILRMANLLLDPQLPSAIRDPNFMVANRLIPYKSMIHILKRFKNDAFKTFKPLPKQLIDELIKKFESESHKQNK